MHAVESEIWYELLVFLPVKSKILARNSESPAILAVRESEPKLKQQPVENRVSVPVLGGESEPLNQPHREAHSEVLKEFAVVLTTDLPAQNVPILPWRSPLTVAPTEHEMDSETLNSTQLRRLCVRSESDRAGSHPS